MATKAEFLKVYREFLVANYPWAKDKAKLDNFMNSVEGTIRGGKKTWNHNASSAAMGAFRMIGCKGKFSLNALCNLPD